MQVKLKYMRISTYHVVLLIYIAWMSFGVFPLVCYEGDSLHIITGCSLMSNHGLSFPPQYSYAYDMQPLVTYIVVLLQSLFAFLSCEQIYCLLSAFASLIFSLGCIRLVSTYVGVGKTLVFLSLFLIPESYGCGMYANSSVLAGCAFIWGGCFLVSDKRIFAFLLLAVAPLLRIDILLVYPSLLFLFMLDGHTFRKSFTYSLYLLVFIVAVVVIGCCVLGANPLKTTLLDYADMVERKHFSKYIPLAVYSFYTIVNIPLLIIGMSLFVKMKQYRLLAFVVVPLVLLHFFFRHSGCATKHYLYLTPFVMMLTSKALSTIKAYMDNSKLIKFSVSGLLVLYLFVSVRFPFRNTPSANVAGSAATLGPNKVLFTESVTPYHFAFGIGAGRLIPTFDEMMLLTVNAFYPFFIREYKEMLLESRANVCELLNNQDSAIVVNVGWESSAFYPLPWIDVEGYGCELVESDPYALRVTGSSKDITFLTCKIDYGYAYVTEFLERMPRGKQVYVTPEFSSPYMLDLLAADGLLTKVGPRVYKLMPNH